MCIPRPGQKSNFESVAPLCWSIADGIEMRVGGWGVGPFRPVSDLGGETVLIKVDGML